MRYQITESLVIGKYNDPALCEDRLIVTDHFVALVDGTTSKSNFTFDGKSTGRMAGELIEKAFFTMPPTVTLQAFISELIDTFTDFYKQNNILEHVAFHPVDRLSASMVVYSVHRDCIWHIGDCQTLVDGKHFTIPKKVDDLLAQARAMVIEGFLANGGKEQDLFTHDVGRAHILELLKWQSYFQNASPESTFSFGVVDGFPIQSKHTMEIPLNGAREFVLASDGYPTLFSSLQESENNLMYILEHDPLCYKLYRATKGRLLGQVSFDDRAYVRLVANA